MVCLVHSKDVWHTAAARLTEAETRTESEGTGKEREGQRAKAAACLQGASGQFSLVNEALCLSLPRCGPRVRQRLPCVDVWTCRSQLCCASQASLAARLHKDSSRAWRVLAFNVRKGLAKCPDDGCAHSTPHELLRAFGPTIRDPGVSGIAARPSDRSDETAFHTPSLRQVIRVSRNVYAWQRSTLLSFSRLFVISRAANLCKPTDAAITEHFCFSSCQNLACLVAAPWTALLPQSGTRPANSKSLAWALWKMRILTLVADQVSFHMQSGRRWRHVFLELSN